MLRYASIEEAWQKSTPPVRRTYTDNHNTQPTSEPTGTLEPAGTLQPTEGPTELAEYDRLPSQRPEQPEDHELTAEQLMYTPQRSVHETPDTCVYDVMLYAISGIVLVLMLEQFVQMGIKLR